MYFEDNNGEWQTLKPITMEISEHGQDDGQIEVGQLSSYIRFYIQKYAKSGHKIKGRKRKMIVKRLWFSVNYPFSTISNNWLKRHGYPMRRKTRR